MICEDCVNVYTPYRGCVYCRIGADPYYDLDNECEDCDCFHRRLTKEEIEELRAEEKLSWRRDHGLL